MPGGDTGTEDAPCALCGNSHFGFYSACTAHPTLCYACVLASCAGQRQVGLEEPLCPLGGTRCCGKFTPPSPPPKSGDRPSLSRLIPVELTTNLQFSVKGKNVNYSPQELFGKKQAKKLLRVRNVPLEMMFEACRSRFQQSSVPDEPELVFHATARQATGSIVKNGFNAAFSGSAHGEVYGKGIYCSPDLSTALRFAEADSENNVCVFICQALMGRQFTPALPPPKKAAGGSKQSAGEVSRPAGTQKQFNSAKSGTIWVVKREQQIVPRYLAYF